MRRTQRYRLAWLSQFLIIAGMVGALVGFPSLGFYVLAGGMPAWTFTLTAAAVAAFMAGAILAFLTAPKE